MPKHFNHQQKHAPVITPKKESFYRIVEHPMKPGDTYKGYQCEIVTLLGGTEISRELVDKPNLFEFAQGKMMDLMDPRNHTEVADAKEFV